MVSIVPLQRRTEASAAAAAARSVFFSLERRRRQEEEEDDGPGGLAGGGGGMDFSGSTQGELAIPMHANVVASSPYGAGGSALPHSLHEHGSSNNGGQQPRSPPCAATAEDTEMETETPPAPTPGGKKPAAAGIAVSAARYRECLKNHAVAIGGNATDGCGEFMPSGEDGSLEALKCSACGCHRNFHRKEAEGEEEDAYAAAADGFLAHRAARRLLAPAMTHPQYKRAGAGGLLVSAAASDPYGVGVGAYAAARALPAPPGHQHQLHHQHQHQYVMPLSMMQTSESDEMDGAGGGAARGGSSSSSRKRFRTKFTAEQKARMLEFAERVGWRLQKLDDAMVQAFCLEIGVKRRVLKVWMHNNKHNLATKRLDAAAEASPQQQAAMVGAAASAMASPPPQMPAAGVMPPPPPPPPQQQQQQLAGPSCLRGGHVSPPPLMLE